MRTMWIVALLVLIGVALVAVTPAAADGASLSGQVLRDCAECPQMVVVPAGAFLMGSPPEESGRRENEGLRRLVTIRQPFAVGVYEVTFAEWDACVDAGGCDAYRPDDEGWGRGERPVINVGWHDAQRYVSWLSEHTGTNYRLLSEAEWEYAARAGTTTRFHTGESISKDQANHDGHRGGTVEVGTFPANAFGLHDVHGNVWEWVEDCWNDSYTDAPTDGSSWEEGDCGRRVLRGGSWSRAPRDLRSARRGRNTTGYRSNYNGFRVARTLASGIDRGERDPLSSGGRHTCKLQADGISVCWGWNELGQATPPSDERFATISSGWRHTCALREDGAAVCWGYDDFGQASPPAGERFVLISSGDYHTCALHEDGTPACWGSDDSGRSTPPARERLAMISSGADHTCGLRAHGTPVCWGNDDFGQASPPAGERFVLISSGAYHTCALREDGTPACWGNDEYGQSTPPARERFAMISSGADFTCGVRADGTAVCWGNDEYGQSTPPARERFAMISSGDYHACGLRADGTPVCWGSNEAGQAMPPDPTDDHGAAPPAPPAGPSPADTAAGVSSTTVLEWPAAERATSYVVYFGTDVIPDSGEYRGEVSALSYDPGPLEPDTTYYWRIDAKNESGDVTTGDVWYFTTAPPAACQVRGGIPVDGLQIDVLDDVSLAWTRACHATGYVVYFGTNQTPNAHAGTYTVETDYSVGDLEAGTTYYWQVNARNAAGETRGSVWSFSTPLPPPEAVTSGRPRDREVGVSIDSSLKWPVAEHASSYRVYFWTQRLTGMFDFKDETTEPSYDPGRLEYGTTYYWRIDTKNGTGKTIGIGLRFTTESEPRADKATGESPPDGAANVSRATDLGWSPVTGATKYDVYFGTDPDPDNNPWPFNEYRGERVTTSYAPGPLDPDTTYYWRIDTKNTAGDVTTGDVWRFTTELGEATTPGSRGDATEVDTSAELQWSPVSGETNDPDSSEHQRGSSGVGVERPVTE